MTPAAFKETQRELGWTNVELGDRLGVRPLTVTRWRTGKVRIPRMAELLIKAFRDGWRPQD